MLDVSDHRMREHAARLARRLGRSMQDLVAFLGELRAVGCDLYLHQQGVDTTTPAGRALFQMLGVFAEFERAIIVERVKAGIARAKAQGKHCGRPFVGDATEQAIRAALTTGKGIRAVARECGVGCRWCSGSGPSRTRPCGAPSPTPSGSKASSCRTSALKR